MKVTWLREGVKTRPGYFCAKDCLGIFYLFCIFCIYLAMYGLGFGMQVYSVKFSMPLSDGFWKLSTKRDKPQTLSPRPFSPNTPRVHLPPMAAVVMWPWRLRVSPAISLSSFSSLSLLLTTYSISIRLPYNHVKDEKSCTLQNTKTRYTLDTSTKQWSGQGLIIRTQSTAIFLCIQPFSAWWQTNKRMTTGWS